MGKSPKVSGDGWSARKTSFPTNAHFFKFETFFFARAFTFKGGPIWRVSCYFGRVSVTSQIRPSIPRASGERGLLSGPRARPDSAAGACEGTGRGAAGRWRNSGIPCKLWHCSPGRGRGLPPRVRLVGALGLRYATVGSSICCLGLSSIALVRLCLWWPGGARCCSTSPASHVAVGRSSQLRRLHRFFVVSGKVVTRERVGGTVHVRWGCCRGCSGRPSHTV